MVMLNPPMPAAAVVLSQELVDRMEGASWQSYSTFRSHPLMMPAIRAHLRVSAREGLPERARELDALLERRLAAIAEDHPSVTRVDGRGIGRLSCTGPIGATGAERNRSRSRAASPPRPSTLAP
jgi:4-aminobutyrate aminotransferase-like enzyme